MTDQTCCGACGYPVHATKEMACDWCRQAADRIETLTANLTKAVEALEYYAVEALPWEADDSLRARTTLAEIKGGNDAKSDLEDCGSLVEAELTHNGICAVGHYVHCGWGHELSPDDLISDDVAQIIADLEAKLAKAVEALENLADCVDLGCFCSEMQMATAMDIARATLAEIKGESHE